MNTRKATLTDIQPLSLLFDQYRVFYGKKSDNSGAVHFLSDRIKNNESVIFVAEDPHRTLAGFVQLYPLFSSTRMKRLWLLNDLFVHPRFRGAGVSKMLIDHAKKLCRDTQACELMLETQKSNHIATQLYLSTGFSLDDDHNYYVWAE